MNKGDRMAQMNFTCSFYIIRNDIYIINFFCLMMHSVSKYISLPKFSFVVSQGQFCSVPLKKKKKVVLCLGTLKLVVLSSVYSTSVYGHVEVVFFFSH